MTHELLREIQGCNWQSIAFSPRDRLAVVDRLGDCDLVDTKTWQPIVELAKGYAPRFVGDGRFILLANEDRQLACFDVATRQRVDLPELPPGAVKYLPASGSKRAILQTKHGRISLWDATTQREIKALAKRAELLDAAFSPDESLVAIAYRSDASDDFSITIEIEQSSTGQRLHVLRPFEQRAEGTEGVQALFWSPDAKYVLAADTAPAPWGSSGSGVSVFSAKTGRHRGQFTGCGKMYGAALLPDASLLVAGDRDGRIYFWDFPSAMKQVGKFEQSLNEADL
jgi:WD40 repeat protein